jgi:phytoene synthase
MPVDLEAAYASCEQITWAKAKNFAYGIRLLPNERRRALAAIYALARRIDDIGDGAFEPEERFARLEFIRGSIRALCSHDVRGDDVVLVALADAARRFPIPVAVFGELVDGCEMDCAKSTYETFDDLVVYCRCVAGSIGRLSLGVFETERRDEAEPLADTLGIALQMTNILRDIVEDRTTMGRVYLPRADLHRFGCLDDGTGPQDAMAELIHFEAERVRRLYSEGLRLLDLLDRRSRACVAAMAGIYWRLLGRIDADPSAVLARRVSLPPWEKAWVAARSLAGAGV